MAVVIDGKSLTLEQVAAVARGFEKVVMSEEAKAAVNKKLLTTKIHLLQQLKTHQLHVTLMKDLTKWQMTSLALH